MNEEGREKLFSVNQYLADQYVLSEYRDNEGWITERDTGPTVDPNQMTLEFASR